MSSHMLAPFRRAWQPDAEREPDEATDAAVVCELCGRETFVGTAYMTARSQVCCPSCWFSAYIVTPLREDYE